MIGCDHCNDIRNRLQQAPGYSKGVLWVDGRDGGNQYLNTLTREQIVTCHCPCHDTWKWTHRVTQ